MNVYSNNEKIDVEDLLGDFLNAPLEHLIKFAKHVSDERPRSPPQKCTPPPQNARTATQPQQTVIKYDRWADTDYYHFLFEVPGISKENIKLVLVNEGNTALLNIEAEKRVPDALWSKIYGECAYGHFVRSVQIPKDVDMSSIDGRVVNGVLIVDIKRLKGSKESQQREIPIL